MKTKQPTMIIQEPKKLTKTMVIKCNDNKTYTLTALGKKVGIGYNTIRVRIERYGWDSDLILAPIEHVRKAGLKRQAAGVIRSKENVNSEYIGLSDRVRAENLARIPGPGLLER